MNTKILSTIIIISLVWGGWYFTKDTDTQISKENTESGKTQSSIMVSTLPVSQLTSAYTLEKIGRIYSQKNVSVSPELSGEIQEILVQDGDMVEIGDPLFRLGLENSNIDIALNQSQRSVEKAQLNLDSITNSQNQQLSSAISSLQRSQIEWDTFIQDKPYAQEILSDTLFHADPDQLGSRAQISIISSQANLDKLKMDYNNKLLSDDQTKQGYRWQFLVLHNSLENLISQLLDTTDLWFDFRNNISSSNIDSYASLDTSYRQQLRSLFTQTEDSLISLSSVEFKEGLSDQEMQSKLDQLETYFNTAENYIDTLESLLRKTVVSSSVTESFLSSQKQQQISYRSQFLSLHSQFLSFDTSVDSFLSLYQSSQDTLAKQVAIAQLNHDNLFVNTASNLKTAQINYQRSSIDLEKREDQLQLALADATTARNTAQSNHDSAIYSAQLSVSDARSALEQTTRNYNKSIVKAPISGEIFQITADIGQTVSPSQKLLSIVDTQDVSVDIMLPKKQYDQLVIGDRVTVDVQGSVSTGIVSTLSSVADTNLQYKVTITLENADLDTVGILAKVYLLLNSEYVLLPVNTLMPVSSSLADVYIYNFGIVEKKSLQLGKTYNSLVEVYTPLDTNFEIITSDMSRYRDGMEITKLTPQK